VSFDVKKAEKATAGHGKECGRSAQNRRHPSPHTRPINGHTLPPETHRPFLDGLAELLASHVVSQITVVPGTRHHRNQAPPMSQQDNRDEGETPEENR
jgi:hypothetical protein